MKLLFATFLVCAQAAFAAVGPSGGGTVIPGGSTNVALLNGTNRFTGPLQLPGITAARVPIIDAGGNLTNSSVTLTTLGYLDATSSVQTQLDSKPTVSLADVARLSQSQTFTGTNTLTGKVAIGSGATADAVWPLKITGSARITGNLYFNNNQGFLIQNAAAQDKDALYVDSSNNLVFGATGYAWNSVGFYFNSATPHLKVSSGGTVIGIGGAAITKVLTATATLNYDLTAAVTQDLTITVTGVESGDVVSIGVPSGSVTATVQFTAWVSATDTVTIRARTAVAGEDPASGVFRATVIKH